MTAKEDKEKEKTRRENLSKFIYQLANRGEDRDERWSLP